MKYLLMLFLFSPTLIAQPQELEIELLPSSILGARAQGVFKKVEWSADSEWFSKPAPVCRSGGPPMDLSKIHELAKAYGMIPTWAEFREETLGSRSEGAFFYSNPNPNSGPKVQLNAAGSPNKGKFYFHIAPYSYHARDEHQKPVVKPLPSKEQAMAIAREWIRKIGIDENELYRHGDGIDGFDVVFRVDYVGGLAYGTRTPMEWDYGMTLNFAQQIGGLPVLWHGMGGMLECEIGDGGEFCGINGVLSRWEKIGDYPVLNREEINLALNEKFFWGGGSFQCETLEIVKIKLEVYHARDSEPQKTFPLLYTIHCKLHGGANDGEERGLLVPALKQQRDRYGAQTVEPNPTSDGEMKPAPVREVK